MQSRCCEVLTVVVQLLALSHHPCRLIHTEHLHRLTETPSRCCSGPQKAGTARSHHFLLLQLLLLQRGWRCYRWRFVGDLHVGQHTSPSLQLPTSMIDDIESWPGEQIIPVLAQGFASLPTSWHWTVLVPTHPLRAMTVLKGLNRRDCQDCWHPLQCGSCGTRIPADPPSTRDWNRTPPRCLRLRFKSGMGN